MDNYFDFKTLLKVINKWKKYFIIVGILSSTLAFIFSSPWFIKPMYRSTAIVYPVNLEAYSEESNTEQMLQILNSIDIKNKIIRTFNLYKHYGIDSLDKFHFTNILNELETNISYVKTEFESVNITVLDSDPFIAANICDSILSFFNQKVSELHRKTIGELVNIKQNQLVDKEKEIDTLEKIITEVRIKYGILDYQFQSERLTEGYVKLLQNGSASAMQKVEGQLYNLQSKGGYYLALTSVLWAARNKLNNVDNEFEDAYVDYTKKITYAQVITAPYPAEKKHSPKRFIIIFTTLISTLIMTAVVIILVENKNKFGY